MSDLIQRIKDNFRYDPETGNLYWKKPGIGRPFGRSAGTVSQGYVRVRFEGQQYKAQDLIWVIVYGCWPTYIIDHIDRDSLNDRLYNLRDVTYSVNNSNRVVGHRVR